ncbi:MAG: carboxymuconolactone decarboxylase family protein [Cyanobacteria bacterium]|nr:carboxymuconolactone decarboxylase family protein [Cyanobacteriota bacterium]
MSRVRIQPNTAPNAEAQKMLDGVKAKMGTVPNIFSTFSHSPAVLEAYLGFSGALGKGKLTPAIREQIALVVAGENSCDYCASAHTALGKMAKIEDAELTRNLNGKSSDPKTEAVLTFARQIVEKRGMVSDSELAAVKTAGFAEAEIVEIIAVVSLNIFTNYFNHIAQTEVDFPVISTTSIKKAALV